MNKIFTLMFLCGGINLCAQNDFEKSPLFDQNAARADKLYDRLTQEEKEFCDIERRGEAVRLARRLCAANRSAHIPVGIDPNEDLTVIENRYQACWDNLLKYNPERCSLLIAISRIRMVDLWKKKADTIGEASRFTLTNYGPSLNYWNVENVKEANELYKMLSPEEQEYCDLIYRQEAVETARRLTDENKKSLVPATISPNQNLNSLRNRKCELENKLKLSETDQEMIFEISARRMVDRWKRAARLVGGKTPFRLAEFFED